MLAGAVGALAGAGACEEGGRAPTKAPPALALSACAFLSLPAPPQVTEKVMEKMKKMLADERESVRQRKEASFMRVWLRKHPLPFLCCAHWETVAAAAVQPALPAGQCPLLLTVQAYKAAKLLKLTGPGPAEEARPQGVSPAVPLQVPPPPLPQQPPQQNPQQPPQHD